MKREMVVKNRAIKDMNQNLSTGRAIYLFPNFMHCVIDLHLKIILENTSVIHKNLKRNRENRCFG